MGLRLIDKTADFSASAIGHAGLFTTLTGNLEALHELRRSKVKAQTNSAPNKADGSVIGSPVFQSTYMTSDLADAAYFADKPASGGMTMAIIVRNKGATGAATDYIIGSVPGVSTTQGAFWFYMYSRRIAFVAYDYPYPAVSPLPGASYVQSQAYIDLVAGDDGNFEMYFGVVEPNVSMRIYRPKTQTMVTTARVGRDFAFDNPVPIRTTPNTGSHDEAMWAHWSGVKSPVEMDTFYGEIKTQFAGLGLSI